MKAAFAFLFLACATATGGTVELRTINSGTNAVAKSQQPQAIAAADAASYQRLWSSTIGEGEPPSVDFASESVVFLLAGEKPTGGWSVEPRGATIEGDVLVVDAAIHGPARDAFVTEALTYPYAVVAVKTKSFKDVRWKR